MRFKRRLLGSPLDEYREEPLHGVANIFDIALAFIAVLVALISLYLRLPDLLSARSSWALVKEPGKPSMELVIKHGRRTKVYKARGLAKGKVARRLGVAYQLVTGEVVYVPEE